jgi:hypothetical protein
MGVCKYNSQFSYFVLLLFDGLNSKLLTGEIFLLFKALFALFDNLFGDYSFLTNLSFDY